MNIYVLYIHSTFIFLDVSIQFPHNHHPVFVGWGLSWSLMNLGGVQPSHDVALSRHGMLGKHEHMT